MSSASNIQQIQTSLVTHQLFSILKSQIISLATALYGTRSKSPSTVFDVLSFTTPVNPNEGASSPTSTYGATGILIETSTLSVTLIQYTGPSSSPFTEWEMLSYVDEQTSMIAGAERLLEDLGKGLGRVVGT
jgi:hypothetical protein